MPSSSNAGRPIPPDAGQPGDVWWCDGVALEFEPHFKRRPVLVLERRDDSTLLVAPLSSKRHYGQEQMVTHESGVSFLTGNVAEVPLRALRTPLGAWEGFAEWKQKQEDAAAAANRLREFVARVRAWFRGG